MLFLHVCLYTCSHLRLEYSSCNCSPCEFLLPLCVWLEVCLFCVALDIHSVVDSFSLWAPSNAWRSLNTISVIGNLNMSLSAVGYSFSCLRCACEETVQSQGIQVLRQSKCSKPRLCGNWRAMMSSLWCHHCPNHLSPLRSSSCSLFILTHVAVLASEPHWTNLTNKCPELQCQMRFPRSRLTGTFESVWPISCFFVPITHLKCLALLQEVSRPSFGEAALGLITLPKYYHVLWAAGEHCWSLDSEVLDKRQKQHFWVPNMATLADILSWEIGTGKAMFFLISTSFLGSNHLFWFSCLLCVCEYVSVHVSKGMWVPAETRRGVASLFPWSWS